MDKTKCFNCGKPIKVLCMAWTLEGVEVLIGAECSKKITLICHGDEHGFTCKNGTKIFNTMLSPCKHNYVYAQYEGIQKGFKDTPDFALYTIHGEGHKLDGSTVTLETLQKEGITDIRGGQTNAK